MDREVVSELIQNECNTLKIEAELKKILEPKSRKHILENYELLEKNLGGRGASKKTAQLIVKDLI